MSVGVLAPPPPPAGSVGVGELLIDAQTARMWFGVPDVVNPAESILVNDYVAVMDALADLRADTETALANGLATKAPLAHTHTASQIADFDSAGLVRQRR